MNAAEQTGDRQWSEAISGRRFICSWSGGKDSALALDRTVRAGGRPAALLTMMTEEGARSRSHGLRVEVLEAQAERLGLPLVVRATSWAEYEDNFVEALEEATRLTGAEAAVFGDIDIEDHRRWCRRVCAATKLACVHPLWQGERRELLDELLRRGYRAVIVAVRDGVLDRRFLGRPLDAGTVGELVRAGVDPCGETGEYHTVVTEGPLFSAPVDLRLKEAVKRQDVWFLDVELRRTMKADSSAG